MADDTRRTDAEKDSADRRRRRRRSSRDRGARRLRRDGARAARRASRAKTSTRRSSATTRISRRSRRRCAHCSRSSTEHEALTWRRSRRASCPGDETDPGARELCVTHYIDRKLAQYESFATPTYFKPPFAKPAKGHRARPRRRHDLRRREGSAAVRLPVLARRRRTPTDKGIAALDAATQSLYGTSSSVCPRDCQDEVIAGMEATDPSAKPGDYPPLP